MTAADHVPSWPELIILMCFGESEEQPFTGIVEVDDRYADGEEDPLPQTVRVHKSGARYRVETLDGDPLFIKGSDREWRFSPGADMPVMITQEDDEGFEYGSYGYAIERPRPTHWRGDDFTIPTGPARQSTYLGRNAWEVELAPPPHKPAPSILTVDAATGMPMRWHSERFGDTFRWTEIERGVTLADDFFAWAGDYAWATAFFDEDDAPGELREMIEHEQRERAEQLAALRIPDLRLESPRARIYTPSSLMDLPTCPTTSRGSSRSSVVRTVTRPGTTDRSLAKASSGPMGTSTGTSARLTASSRISSPRSVCSLPSRVLIASDTLLG